MSEKYVLPPDVVVRSAQGLPPELRSRLGLARDERVLMRPHSRDPAAVVDAETESLDRAVPDAAHDRGGSDRAQRGACARACRDTSSLLSRPDRAGERTGARRRRVGPRRPDRAQLPRGRSARGVRDPASRSSRGRHGGLPGPGPRRSIPGAEGGAAWSRGRDPSAARARGASADARRSGGRPGAARPTGLSPRSRTWRLRGARGRGRHRCCRAALERRG